ncbi:MAG: PEP-CTERM sorting domain-containing protein, partial [Planctomycetales bacterium]|nr:PEP-CTERM sorting domain-containing protein [Planctomycetales bacterium]
MNRLHLAALTAVLFFLAAAPVQAALVQNNINANNTTSNNDLLQTALFGAASTTGTWAHEGSSADPALLTNGSAHFSTDVQGSPSYQSNKATIVTPDNNATVTFNLDTTTKINGYEITRIDFFHGWQDNGRDGFQFTIEYSLIDSPSFVTFGSTANSDPASDYGITRVTDSLGVIATGVDALRFTTFGIDNGYGGLAEIDVIGSALYVAPEPSTALMLGVGLIGLVARRRRALHAVASPLVAALAIGTLLAAAQSASAAQIGDSSIVATGADGAGDRTNIELDSVLLTAGYYQVQDFSFRNNALVNTGSPRVVPFLAELVSPGNYEVIWVDAGGVNTLGVAADTIHTENYPSLTETFQLLSDTNVFAGAFHTGGAIVRFANGGSVDHDGTPSEPLLAGQIINSISNPGLGRTYAFEINVASYIPVPEPSTALLLGMGLLGFVARRRRAASATSLAVLLACFGIAGSAQAVTVVNAGFETDSFGTFPGYSSANGPITGWTSTDATKTGLNPAAGSPFADNGTIPEGTNAAFIQNSGGTGTLSQTITGLVPNETYTVRYRYNARNGNTPRINVSAGGVTLQDTIIPAVGGSNQYYQGSRTFKATGTSATLTFANTQGGGDHTLVFDDVQVEKTSQAKGWTVHNWTNDADSGINPGFVYTHALNWNGSSTSVNGVSFTGTSGGNPSGANFSWAGLANGTTDPSNNVSGAGATLAAAFNYGNAGVTETLTITGLTAGQWYEANFFGTGWDNQPGSRTSHWTADGETVTFNENENGNNEGIRLSYIYLATGTSMQFDVLNVGTGTWHQFAFTNNEYVAIPEPATALLLGLGLVGLVVRRRRVASAASLAALLVCIGMAGSAQAVTVNNSSFEADNFTVFPGYIAGNGGAISGWSVSGGLGLNPAGSSPFANNGATPDGTNVAFIQQNDGLATISQTLTGLTPGETYKVSYRYNARNAGGTTYPQIRVQVDGNTLQENTYNAVGGSNPYYLGTRTFKATGPTATLSFANTRGAGDSAVLIDDVSVEVNHRANGWSVNAWTGDADSGITSSRIYTHALNWNGSSTTVNGVSFTGTSGGNPSGGNFSWTGLPNGTTDPGNNVTGDSATLASSFNFSNDNTTESLTITGLTPGQAYEANFFGVMWDGAQPADRMSQWTADGESFSFNESEFGVDNGIRLSYIYTATGTSMQFDILDLVDATWHQYAFTNNEYVAIPEPSTALLLGVGLVGLCLRRRRGAATIKIG